jgi:hypothetical protein
MILSLLFRFTNRLDELTKFGGGHMMMIGPVLDYYRSQGTGPQTIHVFDGKKSVVAHFTGLELELVQGLIQKKLGLTHMTSRA